jgi:hypothetical protein
MRLCFKFSSIGFVIISLVSLIGCGKSGDSSDATITPPAPTVSVRTTQVNLSGSAEHPDGGTITVTVDDLPAVVTDGAWTYELPLTGDTASPVIRMYRDNTLILVRQLSVSRNR